MFQEVSAVIVSDLNIDPGLRRSVSKPALMKGLPH